MNSQRSYAFLLLAVITTLLLGACAPAATPTAVETSAPVVESAPTQEVVTPQPASASTTAKVELSATFKNAVSVEQQLILGTPKLEGTNLAVSKEQAAMLIPLYTNLKTTVESMMPTQGGQGTQGGPGSQPQAVSAETQAQMDTVIKDILAAMTPEQVKAISEMQITREIAQTIMTEKGISMGGQGQRGEMPGGNGQPPQGTPPAGGQNGGAGAPQQGDAPNGQQPGGGMIPPELINTLIQLLQTK
jgi:hypothetical protein